MFFYNAYNAYNANFYFKSGYISIKNIFKIKKNKFALLWGEAQKTIA